MELELEMANATVDCLERVNMNTYTQLKMQKLARKREREREREREKQTDRETNKQTNNRA